MVLECVPLEEISIDKIRLPFGIPRELVRAKLGGSFEEQNEEIRLDDAAQPIIRRVDVYDQHQTSGSYFLLHYNNDDLLFELEVHKCKRIKLFDIEFSFLDEAGLIAAELEQYVRVSEEKEGYWYFDAIGIGLMDEKRMGGEDSGLLACFYCSSPG